MIYNTFIEKLKKQYDLFAPTYAEVFKEYNTNSIEDYFSLFPPSLRDVKIVDLGCGEGMDIEEFVRRGAQVYGVDSSSEMAWIATHRAPEATIRYESFINTSFPEESFDYVVSKWAIQTHPNIDDVYGEAARLLKPGGTFIFLATHPFRHFKEKKVKETNYFKQEIVESVLFNGKVTAQEPSHTIQEFLSEKFLRNFDLNVYRENVDDGAEKVDGDIYPSYLLIKAIKR